MPAPIPLLVPLLLALALSLSLRCARSDFLPADLPGPFVRRIGSSSCPPFLEFLSDAITGSLPPSNVTIRDEPCTAGALSFDSSEDVLAAFLRGEPGAGATLSLLVTDTLVCPALNFNAGAVFSFVRTNTDVTVEWARVFSKNGTALSAAGSSYTFEPGNETLVLNDLCLFTRLNDTEFDAQRGECFPRDAVVLARGRGRVSVSSVRAGDFVRDASGWTRVVGWTHRDARHAGRFVRVATRARALVASRGHFVYTARGLLPARRVRRGDRIRTTQGWEAVASVESVWREGLYNPQTESGDIVVDGVVCSTYTTSVKPVAGHALLAPVRALAAVGVYVLS